MNKIYHSHHIIYKYITVNTRVGFPDDAGVCTCPCYLIQRRHNMTQHKTRVSRCGLQNPPDLRLKVVPTSV